MSKVINLAPSRVLISQTDIPALLAVRGQLFSQTGQYVISDNNQKILVYLPFGINGGPLYYDYLVFRSTGDGEFIYAGSADNKVHQGSSGQHNLISNGNRFVVVADSGKEWTGSSGESIWRDLGYDYLKEPPQDYDRFPQGYLVKISASNTAPYLTQSILTNFRAYNHSVSSGDFNGDGLIDYVVSGQSTSSVDLSYWSRIGYIVLGDSLGVGDPIWITSPNLEAVGTKKFGMSNVASDDLNGDGRDEIIFSGGASNALNTDKVVVVYQFLNGQLSEYSYVNGYGKFLSNPGYNHYLIDYDKDGDSDLLCYFGVGKIGFELLENTGSGRFKSVSGNAGLDQLSLLDFKHIQILDFDDDGYSDIVLDNLTPDWNLSTSASNLSKAFIKNNGGVNFRYADPVTQASGVSLGSSYQSVVTSFAGKVSPGTYQFVTTYQNTNKTEFGVFTQNISFTTPSNGGSTAPNTGLSLNASEGKFFTWNLPNGIFKNHDKGTPLTYSSDNLPTWLRINSSTGKITGTFDHTAADAAPYSITVTAKDKSGISTSVNLTLSITNSQIIKGTSSDDRLIAGSGTDTMSGLRGNDLMSGGLDNDIINGGPGNDVLTGGGGADRFIFDSKLNMLTNLDQITDFFSGSDQIILKGSIFVKLKGDTDLSDNIWIYGIGVHDADDYLIFDPSDGKIYYDADGFNTKLNAIEFVQLIGINKISYLDFLIA